MKIVPNGELIALPQLHSWRVEDGYHFSKFLPQLSDLRASSSALRRRLLGPKLSGQIDAPKRTCCFEQGVGGAQILKFVTG